MWDLVRTAQDGSSPLSRKGFLIDTMRGVPYLKKKKKRKDMYVELYVRCDFVNPNFAIMIIFLFL